MSRRISLRKGKDAGTFAGATLFSALRIWQCFYLTPALEGFPRMLFHKVTGNTAAAMLPVEYDGERQYQYFPPDYPVYTKP